MFGRRGWVNRRRTARAGAGLALVLALVAAGCVGSVTVQGSPPTPTPIITPTASPTPSPSPTRTPMPTPTPVPTPTISDDDLRAVCGSDPARLAAVAAPYGGTAHPLVLVNEARTVLTPADERFAVNEPFLSHAIDLELQLVLCLSSEHTVKAGSCGTYKSNTGQVGQLYRYRTTKTVRVIVAKTGALRTSKVFSGSLPKCDYMQFISGSPPWGVYGSVPAIATINAWAATLD